MLDARHSCVGALGALALSFAAAGAPAATVDFEDLNAIGDGLLEPGDVITGMTLFGATFSVFNQGNTGSSSNGASPGFALPTGGASGTRELMLFNANCGAPGFPSCSGQDPDLSLPGAGNVLVISEDNDANDPDDSRFGGNIRVTFDPAVQDLASIVLDIDDGPLGSNFVNAYLDGALLGTVVVDTPNGGVTTASLASFGIIDEIIVNLRGSGGIVELNFTPVPVPMALPMFAVALTGLGIASRRDG